MTLETAFKGAAFKVWDELEPVPIYKEHKIYDIREEALATLALKEIIKSGCSQIRRIEMISPEAESERGYDFELAIGSSKQKKFIRFFIQSKRLYGKKLTSRYKALDFEQGKDLEKYARDNQSLGTYAFYNHVVENDLTLEDYYNSGTLFDRRCLGITLTSVYSVLSKRENQFSKYHFNSGERVSSSIYSLRYFPEYFLFHNHYSKHLAIPFHEISYLTIYLAELVNKLYRKKERKNVLPFFFFFFDGMEGLFGGDDLIPIIQTSEERLLSDFYSRADRNNQRTQQLYSPRSIIIINTDEDRDDY